MSTDLIKYNSTYILPPFGLVNTGVICYFNSMLQCLLSCTSIIEKFATSPELQQRNELCIALWETIVMAKQNPESVEKMSVMVFKALITTMRKSGKTFKNFGSGQEDVNEGLTVFIDELNSPEIQQLFEHRYRTTLTCKCGYKHKLAANNIVSGDISICATFHLEELKKVNGNLQQLIIKQTRDDRDGFACVQCKDRGPKAETVRLSMTPEILVITLKKYDNKWSIDVPDTISIPSTNVEPYVYKLVALSDHSGGQAGGHYWANAIRQDNKAYTLNDTSVTDIEQLKATKASYMIWYHIV